jgi:hypothetical protein
MPLIAADGIWFDSAEITGLSWRHSRGLITVKTRDGISDIIARNTVAVKTRDCTGKDVELQLWDDSWIITVVRGKLDPVLFHYNCYEMMLRALKKIEDVVKPIKV